MTTYRCIRDHVESVILCLQAHAAQHQADLLRCSKSGSTRERHPHYYGVREQDPEHLPATARAARMLYLNRACFNGLYRVNKAGRFNVPAGRYPARDLVRAAHLRACSRALKGADLSVRDFADISPEAGDLVYLDPPYDTSDSGSFTAYAANGFDASDQRRVRDVAMRAMAKGATVVVSNHDTALIRDLYNDPAFTTLSVQVPRRVGASRASRRAASEIIVVGSTSSSRSRADSRRRGRRPS